MKNTYLAIERRVLFHDDHSNGERSIHNSNAEKLISSGGYQRSTGFPVDASHWRRSLPDGSCLHLVIEARTQRLHHDAYDPHSSLYGLGMHMSQEARSEAVSLFALAWSTIKLLAR
jgi:hypothetical protein